MPYGGDGLISNHPGGGPCNPDGSNRSTCEYLTWEPIEAGHGPHCEAPFGNANPSLNNHLLPQSPQRTLPTTSLKDYIDFSINVNPLSMYICNNHMMTVQKSGTAVNSFTPRYLLDWSNGRTQTIEFEVNPYAFARMWWTLYIAPPDEFTINTHEFSKHAITFGMEETDLLMVRQIGDGGANDYHPLQWWDGRYDRRGGSYCSATPPDPACDDPRIRRHFKISFNTTHFTMSITKPDGTLFTLSDNWPKPLPFTQGIAMMSHWSYNPTKDLISQFTYHWANFKFDGPATPWKTGYTPAPGAPIDTTSVVTGNGDHLGKNPTDPVHINITSSDLRNPRLWGIYADGGHNAGTFGHITCAQQDQKDTSHWAQVSVNGGPWLDMPTVRDANSVFVSGSNELDNNASDVTFITNLPANSVHQGDNTVQFRSQDSPICASHGIGVGYFEIQVDPNADLPPANPTGVYPTPTPGPSLTPSPSTTSFPTASSSPRPFIGKITLPFDDVVGQDVTLNGEYPPGQINWGQGNWWVSAPWQQFTTKSVSFNGNINLAQGSFRLLVPGHLESFQVFNGGTVVSTVTANCGTLPLVTAPIQPGASPVTIQTNWSGDCRDISMASSNGWQTNFDNMVFADPTIGIISPTPTPSPSCPKGPMGDINCDGAINIFDYNNLVGNFGKSGTGIQGDLNNDGTVNIFDYNILVGNFGK